MLSQRKHVIHTNFSNKFHFFPEEIENSSNCNLTRAFMVLMLLHFWLFIQLFIRALVHAKSMIGENAQNS